MHEGLKTGNIHQRHARPQTANACRPPHAAFLQDMTERFDELKHRHSYLKPLNISKKKAHMKV